MVPAGVLAGENRWVAKPAPRLHRSAAAARAAAAFAALTLAGRQGAAGGAVRPGAVPLRPDVLGCGRPSALAPFPGPGRDHGYPGAHTGALWRVTAPGQQRLVVAGYSRGFPAKFPAELTARLRAPAALRGWSCATGQRLRMCYLPDASTRSRGLAPAGVTPQPS